MATIGHLPDEAIRDQLNRILSSSVFKNSRVLSCFLKFVTDSTLAGKEQEIKEYSIGIHVLSRSKDFNPQLDSVVRINAGRLRRALKEYYYEAGKMDPVLIEMPKGGYIPIFQPYIHFQNLETEETRVSESVQRIVKKPVIAVMPFRNISQNSSRDFFADGLGEQLSTELTWFHNLTVMSYYSSRHVNGLTSDIKEASRLLGTQYMISGSIQSDEKHLHIRVQLILGNSGEQLWAQSFEHDNSASGIFE